MRAILAGVCFVSLAIADPHESLRRALYFADRYNWPAAAPYFADAERGFLALSDSENATHAKIGLLRATADQQIRPLPAIALEIAEELASNPILQSNKQLRLFAFAAKGEIDAECDTSAMRHDWESVAVLARELSDQKWSYRATAQLGLVAFYDGDIETARGNVVAALGAATKAGDKASQVRFLAIISKGLAEAGSLDTSLQTADRALQLAATIPDSGFPYLPTAVKIGALVGLKRLNDAETIAQEVVARAKSDGRASQEVAGLANLAWVLREKGATEESVAALNQALAICRASSMHRLEAQIEEELSLTHRAAKRLDEAALHAQAAADAMQRAVDLIALPRVLGMLAGIQVAMGQRSQALATFERAQTMIDANIGRVLNSYDKTTLVRAASDLYANHFALLSEAGSEPSALFALIEQVRARSLSDLLAAGMARNEEGIAIDRQLARLRLSAAGARTNQDMQRIRGQIIEIEQRRLATPGVSALRRTVHRPITLGELQRTLPPGTMVLEYVLGHPTSFCLVIRNGSARLVRLQSQKRIEPRVREFLKAISDRSAIESGSELHQLLLTPIREVAQSTTIVIIREGILHSVPFDALRTPKGNFVGMDKTFRYAPSASVMSALASSKTETLTSGVVAVGGVPYSQSKTSTSRSLRSSSAPLADLPGSGDEARAISATVPGTKLLLTGREATETAIKNAPLEKFSVLHFAVHGMSDKADPNRAALIMLADPANGEDGFLSASEIAQFRLKARLVTLSACESATGKAQGQEGIENLSRAFFLAGAKNVISTLWQVDDEASSFLMRRFYARFASGISPSAALASAKRDLIRTFGERAHPSLWAGFIIEGGL